MSNDIPDIKTRTIPQLVATACTVARQDSTVRDATIACAGLYLRGGDESPEAIRKFCEVLRKEGGRRKAMREIREELLSRI